MTAARQARGRAGEERAARWYAAEGYRVVARNWRCAEGEIDLVCEDAATGTVVFCEVKSRSSDRYGSPFEAVTPRKQAKVRALATRWLRDHRGEVAARRIRFDVAAVRHYDIEVREGVF